MLTPTLRQLTAHLAADLATLYPAPEAEAIAGQVLEHLLVLTPLQRRVRGSEPVPADTLAALEPLRARLLRHEPLQYVLGRAHFAGLELEVTPATLIPRPETEELVALIAEEQRGRAGLHVLDVGTGSGCIPLALAQQLVAPHLTAVDVSAEALAVARRNAATYEVIVDFQQVDILREEPRLAAPLEVLVSNPPYVLEQERPLMRPNVLDYEPATALFVPNHDPLLFYRRIAQLGTCMLKPDGAVYFEINEQFAAETLALLQGLGYQAAEARPDLFGRPRLVRATWPG
ncbi:release factor glutamine methyltransferase [Hymenobacter luteus]|uniref:peptide chain release factor N(5)-glutamine methyltransferase n=2 Tax=Hymenobacter TaxID=89966 RepID=A0A7W9T2X2_9BACT|nr:MULTISPECIES: peptide chain release factor N(5)-glutamine methyltransferase [Hymenobacter]MBB4603190.1 release factor glutamine methyltransferase [Hymenobacter latericoloratus]MBB6060088.1 release factor glutamine methyltransferase [Hymenobacter luteus]